MGYSLIFLQHYPFLVLTLFFFISGKEPKQLANNVALREMGRTNKALEKRTQTFNDLSIQSILGDSLSRILG